MGDLVEYLTGCLRRLCPYLNVAASHTPLKQASTLIDDTKAEPSYDDVLLLFANIFEVYVPLMRSRFAADGFCGLLASLDDQSLGNFIKVMDVCLLCENNDLGNFLEKLFSCIAYR